MKILLLSPALVSGGVETGTIDLSKSLKNLGEDVIVVSSGGPLVKELEKSGIRHIKLPVDKKSILTLQQIPKLKNIIKEEHIDIVHAQSRVPAWIAYFACKNTCVTFMTSCHGYYSKHLFSSVMGKGERVIVISKIIAKHMQESFNVAVDRIRLVYRGVDLSRYAFKEHKQPKDRFIITNISRITPIKGQREFIKAIDIVAKKIPNIEVWLVGSADKKKKQYELNLHRLLKELNLSTKVKFLGRRTDISEILNRSDLLVLSTQIPEAFGRAIIEAGASGVPVCASRIGGILEIIEDKKDGLLFDVGDIKAMSEAIITMIKNQGLRHSCAKSLRAKVEANFTLKQMSENTLAVYREVYSKKNILIIKLGGLGDLILATPSFRMLRKRFPQARISLLVDSKFEPIIKDCPYVDGLILFERKKTNLFGLVEELKERNFNLSIDFKNNGFTHIVPWLAKIPFRYGFYKGLMANFLNCPEEWRRDVAEQPVRQQFRILQKLGVNDFEEKLELWPCKEDDDFVNGALSKKGVTKRDKSIGLAIGASPEWPTKNWPLESFSRLTQKLLEKGLKVILLGSEHSKEKAEKLSKDKSVVNLVGETSLGQLVSLIKRLDCLITADSAPMHVAAGVGTNAIALFGPTDPKKHLPPGERVKALAKNLDCQPCYKRNCVNKNKLACLEMISVDEVFDLVIKALK